MPAMISGAICDHAVFMVLRQAASGEKEHGDQAKNGGVELFVSDGIDTRNAAGALFLRRL